MSAPTNQMLLFEAVQTQHADGSITVSPKRLAMTKDIGAKKAARMLGLHVETVYRLCALGESRGGLYAWKLPSTRGNAKWRIDWQSAACYKQRREAQLRDGGW